MFREPERGEGVNYLFPYYTPHGVYANTAKTAIAIISLITVTDITSIPLIRPQP